MINGVTRWFGRLSSLNGGGGDQSKERRCFDESWSSLKLETSYQNMTSQYNIFNLILLTLTDDRSFALIRLLLLSDLA